MKWTAEGVTELGTQYWKSCVLSAAVELGLFDTIGRGARAEDVSAKLSSSPRHTAELLDALVSLEILVKKDGVYSFEASAAEFFDRASSKCVIDALRFNSDLYQLWGKLSTCVREGKPVLPARAHLGDDPERTRRFVMGMHSRALMMAPPLLPAINLEGHRKLLDIGAGPGTFSRFLLEKTPGLNVTLFDLPPVLNVARELTAGTRVADRVAFSPGDYRKDELPSGFDVALYSGALHQETPETAAALFAKIAGSLEPGGAILVVDMMVRTDRTSPLFSILFSLNMMLMSPIGRVFPDSSVHSMLAQAGFADLTTVKPDGCPYWIVRGRKMS